MSTSMERPHEYRDPTRYIRTPEGIDLPLKLAAIMMRLVAFVIDFAIISGATTLVFVLASVASDSPMQDNWWIAVALFASFVLRNCYFLWFETRNRGQTPGKRLTGIRVVDRHGRPLTADAVFLRNVTRDMETVLPLVAIFIPATIWPGAPWWVGLISMAWLFVIGALPFLNRDNMRAGDLIAGTIVVVNPKGELGDDVGARTAEVHELGGEFTFTSAQLDMYGIYELQVLEDVLRGESDPHTLHLVAERIVAKIGWTSSDWALAPAAFLDAFYRALRGRLEHRMLLGDRQEHKKEGKLR